MAKAFIFVDSRVLDWQSLLAGAELDTEVVILNAESDGVEQIHLALQGVTDLASIHIISHGSSGTLYLGATVLTEENLDGYPFDLARLSVVTPEYLVAQSGPGVPQGLFGLPPAPALLELDAK